MRAPLLTAALFCRCPRCGVGPAFTGFLTTTEVCANCGLAIGRSDNGDGPAVFLIFIIGFLVVPVALWIAPALSWPDWAQGLLWSAVILAMTVGLLRPAKALVIALNYRYRSDDL